LTLLESWKIVSQVATTAREALEQVESHKVSVALVDLILLDSRIDGGAFTFLEQLRQKVTAVPPVVLVLDAVERTPKAETLKGFGVSSYVVKPVWRADLEQSMMIALLEGAASQRQSPSTEVDSMEGAKESRLQ
jgi:CheY-like chemotaxis protein